MHRIFIITTCFFLLLETSTLADVVLSSRFASAEALISFIGGGSGPTELTETFDDQNPEVFQGLLTFEDTTSTGSGIDESASAELNYFQSVDLTSTGLAVVGSATGDSSLSGENNAGTLTESNFASATIFNVSENTPYSIFAESNIGGSFSDGRGFNRVRLRMQNDVLFSLNGLGTIDQTGILEPGEYIFETDISQTLVAPTNEETGETPRFSSQGSLAFDFEFNVASSVPEPSNAILAAGFGIVTALGRRRKITPAV